MEEIGPDRLNELGAKYVAEGDADRAIHYYNLSLRTAPGSARTYLGLARALSLKAAAGAKPFEVLAMDALRKAAAADPSLEDPHSLLISAAARAGRLGDLAVEYREKLRLAPDDEALKRRLKSIYLLSLMDRTVRTPTVGYKPILYVKVFFDCVLLPLGASMIVAANVLPKARPSLGIGIFIFFCYACYRWLIWFLSRL